MDTRGGVLPEGMSEVASAGSEFYANPHHNFLYGDNGALKFSLPPAYPNEFAFTSQVDATSLPFTHQPQQTHQLQFSNQTYAPQTAVRSPLPQNAQPSFGDPYAAQHLRQHVRQSPSTISPAQLQPQAQPAYHQSPLTWDDITQFSNANDHQLQGLRQQTTASVPPGLPATSIHPHTLAPPASSDWVLADSTSFPQSQVGNSTPLEFANYLPGCYWATADTESHVPEEWAESIQTFWRLKIDEARQQPTKSQKRTSSQAALPPSPIDLSGDPNPSKRAKLEKNGKAVSTRKTISKPLPTDPIERLKESVIRLMRNPDVSDPAKVSLKFWELMQEAGTDPEKRLVLIKTATREGSPEVWRTFARNITVPGRLQQWIAQVWNSDKASPLLPLCMRIIRQLNLSTSELQASSLHKTITFLSRKKTYPTIAELADQILSQAEKLEQQNIANGIGGREQSTEAADKSLTKPNTITNAGLKRSRDDADNGGKTDGAIKKPSMALVKPTTPVTTSKAAVPATARPTPTVMPVAAPIAIAPTTTTTITKPKPTTNTSSFFKSMASLGAGTRPAVKATTVTPAPPPKTQGYSSIFDQLRERQKKDEEEAALRAKGGKVPEKEEEVTKKGKKKKTVRWKPDNLLAEITLFQVLEPIGEYYGGGDGKGHVFGDARSLDVEEGKDALAALKNRKALEEEEDIYIDWYQPIGQPPTPFAFPLCFLQMFIVRLFLYSEICGFPREETHFWRKPRSVFIWLRSITILCDCL
ncbi:hypothetical protein BGX38DRAFT_648505 [Terfezia claveryi]|nr:hypothetical protein BGX38DRAFT_648505 [Terfezia claveryi]